MKTFLISAATLLAFGGAASAWANPPPAVVSVPADPSSPSEARAYTDALTQAIERQCRLENNPVFGLNELHYESCIQSERDHIAATEPTGLFASRLGITRHEAEKRLAILEADDAFHG
jgi:hypothetical protein